MGKAGKKNQGPAFYPMFLISKEQYLRWSHAADQRPKDDYEEEDNYLQDRLDYLEGPSFRGPGKRKRDYSTWFASLMSPQANASTVQRTPGPVPLDTPPAPPPAASTPKISWKEAFQSGNKRRKCPLCDFTCTKPDTMLSHVQAQHDEDRGVRQHFDTIQKKVGVKKRPKLKPSRLNMDSDDPMEEDDGDSDYEDIPSLPDPPKKRPERPPKGLLASPVTPAAKRRPSRFKRTPAKLMDFARPKRGRGFSYDRTKLAKLLKSL